MIKITNKTIGIVIINCLAFLILFLFQSNLVRTLALSVLFISSVYILDKKNLLFYLVACIGAPLSEAVIMKISKNVWEYKNPNIIGIPYWLFPLWGTVIICWVGLYEIYKQ